MNFPRRHHLYGFTLIEIVVVIVVVAVALLAILAVINQSTRASIEPMVQQQANAIAHAYLEEVMLQPFCDDAATCTVGGSCNVCPVPEASRSDYDNVCDYNNLNDAGARDQNGTAIAGLGDYAVNVAVDSGATLNGLSGASCQVVKITVNVSHAVSGTTTLIGYRTNY